MKKIIFCIIGLVLGFNSYSQQIFDDPNTVPSQKGDYVRDNQINKYVGTWEWRGNNETFIIIIKKRKLKVDVGENFYAYKDIALGWHKYIKNEKIVDEKLEEQNTEINTLDEASYLTSFLGGSNENDISFTFRDKINNKKYRIVMTLSPNEQEASWVVYNYNSTVALKDKNKKKQNEDIKLELAGAAKNVTVTQNQTKSGEGTFYLPIDVILKKVK